MGDTKKLRPLGDRIIVKRKKAEERSKGGIIIPDNAKETPAEGEVHAVGPGGRDATGNLQEPSVRPGDHILFGEYAGNEVKVNGEMLVVIREEDILAVVEETA